MTGCTCDSVDLGTYANQETRKLPFSTPRWPMAGTKTVGIDRCILPDVEALWAAGVETIESCCGHGKTSGYIAVPERFRDEMLSRGYLPDPRAPERMDLYQWPRPSW